MTYDHDWSLLRCRICRAWRFSTEGRASCRGYKHWMTRLADHPIIKGTDTIPIMLSPYDEPTLMGIPIIYGELSDAPVGPITFAGGRSGGAGGGAGFDIPCVIPPEVAQFTPEPPIPEQPAYGPTSNDEPPSNPDPEPSLSYDPPSDSDSSDFGKGGSNFDD